MGGGSTNVPASYMPQQQAAAQSLYNYMAPQIGQRMPTYPGQLTAQPSQYQQQALGWLGQYLGMGQQNVNPPSNYQSSGLAQQFPNFSYGDPGQSQQQQQGGSLANYMYGTGGGDTGGAPYSTAGQYIDPASYAGYQSWLTAQGNAPQMQQGGSPSWTPTYTDPTWQTSPSGSLPLETQMAGSLARQGYNYGMGQQPYWAQPDVVNQYYQQAVVTPQMTRFNEETLPAMLSQYSKPGGPGYWGNARADAAQRATRDFTQNLDATQAQLQYQERARTIAGEDVAYQRGQAAIPQLESYSQIPLQMAQAGLQLGSMPQQWSQTAIQNDVSAWMQSLAQNNPVIAQALAGIGAQFNPGYTQQGPSAIPQLAGTAAGLGMYGYGSGMYGTGSASSMYPGTTAMGSLYGAYPGATDYLGGSQLSAADLAAMGGGAASYAGEGMTAAEMAAMVAW